MVSQRTEYGVMHFVLLHSTKCLHTLSDEECRPLRHFAQMTAKFACVTAVEALGRLLVNYVDCLVKLWRQVRDVAVAIRPPPFVSFAPKRRRPCSSPPPYHR